MDGIRDLLSRYKFDALALNETVLSPDIDDTEVTILNTDWLAKIDPTQQIQLEGESSYLFEIIYQLLYDQTQWVTEPRYFG